MTTSLLNADAGVIAALMDLTVDLKSFLTIDRLQWLYANIYEELDFKRILDLFGVRIEPDPSGDGEYPSKLTLWHINSLMQRIVGKFGCEFYKESISVRNLRRCMVRTRVVKRSNLNYHILHATLRLTQQKQ